MSSDKSTATASSGIGIFGLLTAILLVFKLGGLAGASWGLASIPWWVVFLPVGIAMGTGALFFLLFLFFMLIQK